MAHRLHLHLMGVTMRSRKALGFTLVELMIVVGIIGVLAAIAIPAFTRYIRKSRTAEAVGHLNKLYAGAATYYMSDFSTIVNGQGVAATKQFPSGTGPWERNSVDCCAQTGGKCPGGSSVWTADPIWVALKFSVPDPHAYVPGYTGAGTGSSSTFTAGAFGNLDCDATISEFTRQGYITTGGDVAGQVQATVKNEME